MRRFMSRFATTAKIWPVLALLAIAIPLAGCGAPYVDSRREAGQLHRIGASTKDRIAICYSASGTTPQDLQAMAEAECAKTGRIARFVGQRLYQCSLTQPHIAYYACTGASEPWPTLMSRPRSAPVAGSPGYGAQPLPGFAEESPGSIYPAGQEPSFPTLE